MLGHHHAMEVGVLARVLRNLLGLCYLQHLLCSDVLFSFPSKASPSVDYLCLLSILHIFLCQP